MSPLGQRHLKDIDQPEQVYELAIEGVETVSAEITTDAPAPPAPPSIPDQAEFRDRLRESINERVQRELLAAFGDAEKEVVGEEEDDAAVDDLAVRTADLGDQIAARVEAALRKRR